ncbi:Tartrate-resistant acid phosphatase type 5 [Aphelenchoides besseyi]|nr:Tartrate-resistant acid phosphatase type 5 [Aphelenchoides besseyi]
MKTFNYLLYAYALFTTFDLSATLTPTERTACTKGFTCLINKNQIDFFVIGDSGGVELNVGSSYFRYARATPVQTKVANAMAKLAGKEKLDFVLNVGDNVYFNGVDRVNDTRFKTVFEDPYADPRLEVPWFTIAGNHDYLGNVSAQIDYTKYSNKWTFPSRYYKASYAFAKHSKTVDLIFLDTVMLCGNSIDVDSRSIFSWMRAVEKEPQGPEKPFIEEAKKQWAWLENQLKTSKADYVFVVGHYPIYSISLQKLKCISEGLDPLLHKYQATAYIAGHDHSLQYFRSVGPTHKSMRYLISGAASRTGAWGDYKGDKTTNLLYRYPQQAYIPFMQRLVHKHNELGFGQGGFVHVSVRSDHAYLFFYVRDLELRPKKTMESTTRIFTLLAFVSTSVHSFSLVPSQRVECTKGDVCALDKDQLDFIVVGDTGGLAFDVGSNFLNYIRTTDVQLRVADSMAEVAQKEGLDFIINVGDNVYWNGVDDVFDTRFETVFETPYQDDRLSVPWYMILGNHDHLGNASAQIDYTKYSNKWTMPNLYYKASYAFNRFGTTADFIFIDTIVLCGNSIDVDSRSLFAWFTATKHVPDRPPLKYVEEAVKQWAWIEEQLKNSRADYLFVIGHYPIHSMSAHGPVKCLVDRLDPLLRKYNVTAYFSGHDHALQFYRFDNSGNDIHYIVSGTGSRTDSSEKHLAVDGEGLLYHFPRHAETSWWRRTFKQGQLGYGWGGFTRFQLKPTEAEVYFYVRSADLEYKDINQSPQSVVWAIKRKAVGLFTQIVFVSEATMTLFHWFIGFLIISFTSAYKNFAGLSYAERTRCLNGNVCALNKSTIDVFVLGDTGGVSFDLTHGFGTHWTTKTQRRVAISMAELSEQVKADFIINLGDNIYWNGPDDVNDSRFETLFEEPYVDARLLVPWYMLLGNHDHLGNATAEIEYSKKDGKWTMPHPYYKASYSFDGGRKTADFIFIDTIYMCGNTVDLDSRSIARWIWTSLMNKKQLLGPGITHTKLAEEQWNWLETQLKTSTADYVFVSGHYPIHSISSHGPLKCLKDKLDTMMRRYNVTAYFAGHDHTLQHFRETKIIDDNRNSTMHYIVSGAGSRVDPSEANFNDVNAKDLLYRYPKYSDLSWFHRSLRTYHLGTEWGGFVRLSVTANQTEVFIYAGEDAELTYKFSIPSRPK